ncbi:MULTISPECIES: restriction endonuclease subunit S [unclassified Citrobacter]|uniref:restriction endonuclease subunit S n=1 Tax=unclassified Citrobacter TaxID=2644389 RepID=UPI002168FDCD|nr:MULTISPECIES: restriction endonuclease subunit S [unclassified Citrobacter]MCS3463154.1 type I restriction enzyme S subunit [Citrobacter sp. JUb117]MDW2642325.1 restriction endonuclease subunit S [Citrobacter sp. HN-141]MDW2651672.1 restriction endonuclease subunit S [Citrobacter sp. HN-120]MDW2694697.1 restriction endonuclease subunit S [Citrobacter sp. HN-144]
MAVEKLITQHIDTWTSALQTRSTAGRGSNGKIDLYGIKKLRELILELAVRGKLVPQDPTDEPASELLKRIAAEKAELVKQGKIKKQKLLPEISEDEKPYELPVGWECARLGNTVAIIRGITFPASEKHKEPSEGKVACLRTANVQDSIEWDDLLYVSESFVKRSEQFAEKGDIVMSMANSRELVGKVAYIYNIPTGSATFGGFLSAIRPYGFNAAFLMSVLRSPNIKSILIDSSSQTTNIANISLEKLNPLVISVPPIGEQNRIASKVEELMSLCDQLEQQSLTSLDAHQQLVETLLATLTDSQNAEELAENWARISQHFDTLFTTGSSIDALKQTILQLAVMGKLVPQDPNDEPASELLKRIEQEKSQLVKEGKIKKQKPLPPVSDEEKPFELPVGWEWCRIGEIIANMDAGWSPACSPEPSPNEDIWGVLKTTAVQSLEYREQENKTLPSSKLPRPQYEVHDGDILVTRAGPKNRVGVSCLVEKTRSKLMISDKIIRFHLISDDISAKYISLCLNRGVTADYLEASKSGMAESQMNISQENLRSAPIALPPTAIQLKVISTIEDFFKVCDQLKSRLQSAQQTQLHLADAFTDAALS